MAEVMEQLLDAHAVVALVAELTGRRPHVTTVRRWFGAGVSGAGGTVVRLACQRVGGLLFTTRAAVEAFLAATQTK